MSSKLWDRIADSFAAQTMMATLGARLTRVEAGHVEITAEIRETCLQQHGFAHAGVGFSIGDSAAGYAALTLLDDTQEVLTTEMKINLLAPAQGEMLVARGQVIKPGRRLVIVQSDIFAVKAQQEVHIARMLGTMMPVERPQ